MMLTGPHQPHDRYYNRVTSILTCARSMGCQRRFLIGLIAWPMKAGGTPKHRPADQIPPPPHPADRAAVRGVFWRPAKRQRGHRLTRLAGEPLDNLDMPDNLERED